MHWIALVFLLALPLAAAPVLVLGDNDARLVAGGQVGAFAFTLGLRALETWRFAFLSTGIAVIDVVLLMIVMCAAIRTSRPWIVVTASLLVFPPLGHFAKLIQPDLWPGGYWLMTNAPSIPCALLLAWTAWNLLRHRWSANGTLPASSATVSPPRRPRNI